MEGHGEQFTVVFALIVAEPARECVCVGEVEGGVLLHPPPPPPPISRSRNNLCKDDSALFSRNDSLKHD
jgi:hypothetical protein